MVSSSALKGSREQLLTAQLNSLDVRGSDLCGFAFRDVALKALQFAVGLL